MPTELFRTVVPITPSGEKLAYQQKIMMLGSCFTENIGDKLSWYKFQVDSNPFGIIYNPLSIKKSIDRIIENKSYTEQDLRFSNGLFYSYDHHSRFSHSTKEECLSLINSRLNSAHKNLSDAHFMFITFGSAFLYKLKENTEIVANCHKQPERMFNRFRLTVHEIVEAYRQTIPRIATLNPRLKLIFTVSPIRHWRDGAHDNQLSKAILLLAIEELCQQFERVAYFPAYELVLDELRDYRFYEEDMLHPNKTAIDFVWNRFVEAFIETNSLQVMKEIEKIQLARQHRPFNQQSKQFQDFLHQQLDKIERLTGNYPFIDLKSEYLYFKDLTIV